MCQLTQGCSGNSTSTRGSRLLRLPPTSGVGQQPSRADYNGCAFQSGRGVHVRGVHVREVGYKEQPSPRRRGRSSWPMRSASSPPTGTSRRMVVIWLFHRRTCSCWNRSGGASGSRIESSGRRTAEDTFIACSGATEDSTIGFSALDSHQRRASRSARSPFRTAISPTSSVDALMATAPFSFTRTAFTPSRTIATCTSGSTSRSFQAAAHFSVGSSEQFTGCWVSMGPSMSIEGRADGLPMGCAMPRANRSGCSRGYTGRRTHHASFGSATRRPPFLPRRPFGRNRSRISPAVDRKPREWRNWQPRGAQNPLSARTCEFESRLPHHLFSRALLCPRGERR